MNENRNTIAAAAASAGREERQRDLAEARHGDAPSVAAASRQARIEVRPERPDDAHDDGDVEERVRDQDRRPPALDAVGEDREERERDDDRRQHERHDDERADDAAAAESVAAEHVRRRERDASVSTVDASACHSVNHTTSRVSGSVRTSTGGSPAPRRPRSRIAASGIDEEHREERERHAVA